MFSLKHVFQELLYDKWTKNDIKYPLLFLQENNHGFLSPKDLMKCIKFWTFEFQMSIFTVTNIGLGYKV